MLITDIALFIFIAGALCCASYLESLVQVVKYSFFESHPFSGGLYANALSILARVFLGIGTIVLAAAMEAGLASVRFVFWVIFYTSAVSIVINIALKAVTVNEVNSASFRYVWLFRLLYGRLFVTADVRRSTGMVKAYMAPLVFMHAGGFLLIYLLAAIFPRYRLTINAFSPVISMIGTLFLALFFEPRLSNRLVAGDISSNDAKNFMLSLRMWGYAFAIVVMVLLMIFFHDTQL